MGESVKEFCGIFGIYDHPEAAHSTYLGLFALQHRGQESAGIVSSDGSQVYSHIDEGLVADVFADRRVLSALKGHIAIGHNRYSTTGSGGLHNVQPLLARLKDGPIAIAHNGNLVNSGALRRKFEEEGAIFQSTTDSEVILHLISRSRQKTLVKKLLDACKQMQGAFCIAILTPDQLIAVRDPHGFRPLALGKMNGRWLVASESCAFDLIGADYIRDVMPGEIIVIDKSGFQSIMFAETKHVSQCIFEYVYFSRPDSRIFGDFVDKTRRKLGKNLAIEDTAEADIVFSVPDSSNTAALGYAQQSGIKYEIGLIRNHYIGRTFIHPSQADRNLNVRLKFNTVGGVLKDRKIVVVEDSIVRGTTLKKLTSLLRKAGAKEVHVRVSSPPIRFPCFYGMDFPTSKELVASGRSVEEVKERLGVDSLHYLSQQRMVESAPSETGGYCCACFDGNYPVPIDDVFIKNLHEKGHRVLKV